MSIIAVPSPLQERQRSVVRYREQLVRNRRRAEARGRAFALTQGILAPVGWWRPAAWKQFKSQLPEHGSRTWSAIPANYDPEAKRLTLQQTPFGNGACTNSHLGAQRARTLDGTVRSRPLHLHKS